MGSNELQFCLFFLSACNDLTGHHLFIEVVPPYHQKSKFFFVRYFLALVTDVLGYPDHLGAGKKRINNALNNGGLLLGDLFIVVIH